MLKYESLKVVADPISGLIDIGPILPLVNTRAFQALADKRQLGMTYLVFRQALHTRLIHCLGAYHDTAKRLDKWLLQGIVTREERDAVVVYAALHDVQHNAFSHVTDDFCEDDDDERALRLIQGELKEAIEECGANSDLVEELASHKNPLYLAVHDKNLGTEKLDYLERDGFYTINSRPSGIDFVKEYVYFVDGKVVIDEKIKDYTEGVMNFYMEMYKQVYFRKSLVIAQRMFHKMVYHLILANELDPKMLTEMTDSELLAIMYFSKDPVVQNLYTCLRERRLFKEAIVFRPEAFVRETRLADKHIMVFPTNPRDMHAMVSSKNLQKNNHPKLEEIEKKIEVTVGLPEHSILVVPVFNPERFEAKDVMVLGSNNGLYSLKEERPSFFARLEEIARSYTALRICTRDEYRQTVSCPSFAVKIMQIIYSVMSDPA